MRQLTSVMTRLRPAPASESEQAAAEQLRSEIAALPPLPTGGTWSEREWLGNRQLLRDDIRSQDPRSFLGWQVLRNQMVVSPDAAYIADVELPALRDAGWLPLLPEDLVGAPAVVAGTSTSANLAHHAYHLLRFGQATGLAPLDLASVVELGAGYGSMCRLLNRLSLGRVRATLFDLPEFSALQRYYLARVGVDATYVSTAGDLAAATGGSPRLLIATWSLSEMPVATRPEILDAAGQVDAYLVAYQERFGEVDNVDYFDGLVRSMPDVDWVLHADIGHLPGQRYLFGARPTDISPRR